MDNIANSILQSVKKMLGINPEYEEFDVDIILHINSVFSILSQIGAGPASGFMISDGSATWADYMEDSPELNNIKSYMYLKVRLLFDPPQNSAITKVIETQVTELEYRINYAVDKGVTEG